MSRYAAIFLRILTGGLTAVFAFNAAVDPLDVFQWWSAPGWNASKYVMGTREEKKLALMFDGYDGLVVGTSRAEMGYRPDHPGFGGRAVYSATLTGTNMLELEHFFMHALERQRPEVVVFGLDFLLFGSARDLGAEGRQELGLPHVGLSLFALRRSVATLEGNLRGQRPRYVKGHRLGSRFAGPLAELGHAVLFERTIRNFLTNPELFHGFRYGTDRVESLRRVVAAARAHDARSHLVINPVHALQLETVQASRLWETFEQWKRDLVQVAEATDPPVPLWDFTSYSGPQAEPVPGKGDRESRMQWYFECSHFRPALGDRVLDRVLGTGGPDPDPDFGVRLQATGLEGHLARLRRDRLACLHDRPRDVELVRRALEIARRRDARSSAPPPDSEWTPAPSAPCLSMDMLAPRQAG